MTEEIWKPIEEFENYAVSNMGNVKNTISGRILKKYQTKIGYIDVSLTLSGKTVTRKCHRLVALAFLPNPQNKPQVDHIDRCRNNNELSNLRWATAKEQALNRSYIGHHDNSRRRSIWKCDKETGERIELFQSSTLAAQSVLHTTSTLHASNFIMSIARSNKVSAYGFKWEFDDDITIEGEEWKEIDSLILGFQREKSSYFISNRGRLRTPRRGTLTPRHSDTLYPIFTINKTIFSAHRLVALMFLERQEGKDIVNHIDGNKCNCNVDNLEWVTPGENVVHAFDTGLHPEIIDVYQYELSGKFIRKYPSITDAARAMNAPHSSIKYSAYNGTTYGGFQWKARVDNTRDILPSVDSRFKFCILQYTLSGEFVREFRNSREAADSVGVNPVAIQNATRHQGRTCQKFQWRDKYSRIPVSKLERKKTSSNTVRQYNLDGAFICEYKSINQASMKTGFTQRTIKKFANSGEPFKGFIWVNVEEYESKKRKRDD